MHVNRFRARAFSPSACINRITRLRLTRASCSVDFMESKPQYSATLLQMFSRLVYKDEFGDLVADKWFRKFNEFIHAKVRPALFDVAGSDVESRVLHYKPSWINDVLSHYLDAYNARLESTDPKWNGGTPADFEGYCSELLQTFGFAVTRTGGSGDQGADLIARRDGVSVVVQCKLQVKAVGNSAVQEVGAARQFYNTQLACVVSFAAYTASARQLAKKLNVHLLHPDALHRLRG